MLGITNLILLSDLSHMSKELFHSLSILMPLFCLKPRLMKLDEAMQTTLRVLCEAETLFSGFCEGLKHYQRHDEVGLEALREMRYNGASLKAQTLLEVSGGKFAILCSLKGKQPGNCVIFNRIELKCQ